MSRSIIILLLLVVISNLVSSKKFQLSSKYSLSCRKDSDGKVSKENLVICLAKLLRDESRKEDKEMMEVVAKDFVDERVQDRVSENQVDDFVRREIEEYVENWKRKMYMKLIDMLDIEYDREFLEVMLKDPEFYGLTYDSYRILSFKFEDN